ncbi:hypothetical protein AB4Z32_27705, partial [Massilia sp. 2TAF26]|uniref:hypothetical protein n=2 Tax=cellular organisms TaxID=131567 RepID=UPI003F953333
ASTVLPDQHHQIRERFLQRTTLLWELLMTDEIIYPVGYVDPSTLPRHITKLAFRNRFTQAEKVAIEMAALDDPSASLPARQQSAAIRASLADSAAASYIDLNRTDTRAGVQALEDGGILAMGRAQEILDAAIADEERPKGP